MFKNHVFVVVVVVVLSCIPINVNQTKVGLFDYIIITKKNNTIKKKLLKNFFL